jgi:hypothetical protein
MIEMRRFVTLKLGALILLASFLQTVLRVNVSAQDQTKQPIVFKTPKGYLPADLSKHLGKMFLAPKKPVVMFVGYPDDGQDMTAFREEIKKMVQQMFIHDPKTELVWTSTKLPAHKGVEGEAGTLMMTSDDKMEVQLAFYTRPEGVAYGYAGMRHKKGQSDDARFLDASGAGVKEFDQLAESIGSKPK